MHLAQATLLAQAAKLAETLGGKEAASPVLWKYVDEDSGQEFFLTVRLPSVHSPFTGKSVHQRPEKAQLPSLQKELRQVEAPVAPPAAEPPTSHWYPVAAQRELLDQATSLLDKLAASPVLWKYVDPDSGQEFFLPSRRQNVHSPYTGKSAPQRPEKFQMAEVQKELRQESKGPAGAPGPKAGAPKPKAKGKKKADDPDWKIGPKTAASWEEVRKRELEEMQSILHRYGYDPKDAEKLAAEGMGPEELEHRIKTTKPGEMGSLEYTHSLQKKAPGGANLDELKPWVASLEANAKKVHPFLFGGEHAPGKAVVRLGAVVRDCAAVLEGLGVKHAKALDALGMTIQHEAAGL